MIQSIPAGTAKLPSAFERQQIFYCLQKVSSVTAWRRIFEYYKKCAEIAENSWRLANEQGWGDRTGLPQSDYVLILTGLAHCEKGLARLGKGDKRVFKFDANGEFAKARRVLFHWAEMTTCIEEGENWIDEKHTPLWADFNVAITAACQAWQECARDMLEPRYLGEPAQTLYGEWLKEQLEILPFPDELAPVPHPIDNKFVKTNAYTPCSGIWEPIEVSSTSKTSLMSMFKKTPQPQSPFKIAGAMNYLHAGSSAPKITVETANDSIDLDTTWRLLWRDDRYNDGSIPKEEAHYRFIRPEKYQHN